MTDFLETLPRKEQIARALLMRGSVFVHLDGRADGVSLPDWLRKESQVVLQLGLDLPVPILDLRVDEQGFFGTLAFQHMAHVCQANWHAVYALVGEDGRGMVWPESLPCDLSRELGASNKMEVVQRKSGKAESKALHLISVVGQADPQESLPPTPAPDSVTRLVRHKSPASTTTRPRELFRNSPSKASSSKSPATTKSAFPTRLPVSTRLSTVKLPTVKLPPAGPFSRSLPNYLRVIK